MWVIMPNEDRDLGDVHPRSPVEVEQYGDGHGVVRVLPPPCESEDTAARSS
jgi:hypothetical protein